MKKMLFCFSLMFHAIFPTTLIAQSLHVKLENQFSGWATLGFSDPLNYQFGVRYIPTLSITDSLKKSHVLDTEVSFNTYGNVFFTDKQYDEGNAVFKPYRLWVRYAMPRLEFRIGLQKINFGSAAILRPLMWFDKMDFRDPLKLTDGVYAFLGRYYFQRNANIWFWTLYGNDKTKGWEVTSTKKHTPEFGGRIQVPLGKGETAISYHHRKAMSMYVSDSLTQAAPAAYPEDRFGIDGKWDIGVGLWFEFVIRHNAVVHALIRKWETYFNLGTDYTFPLGNGLNVTAEYFRYCMKDEITGTGLNNSFIAVAANYPMGIMNNLTAMIYYNWDQKEWYRIISLQRKYDYWSFYLLAFWNPSQFAIYHTEQDRNLFAGKGIQFMAVVNF